LKSAADEGIEYMRRNSSSGEFHRKLEEINMRMRKCLNCGTYTLRESCIRCGGPTNRVKPARFSPEDRYGKYRRMMKAELKE